MSDTSRRRFLRQMAAATAAASVSPSLLASCAAAPLRKDGKLGVALVGLGYYSTELLAPALQRTQNCYLAGIVTGSPEKAETWKKQYGLPDKNIYNYQNFDRIADNRDIDVVYVVLPNSLHREFTVRAANAGKHVWCEKPMAMNAAECEAMIEACRKNKVKLSIGYRMQHEPNTQDAIRLSREKTLGKVMLVNTTAGFFEGRTSHWHTIKALGGGAMYDMGVYPLNAARYIVGEEPLAVSATQAVHRPEIFKGIDETMMFQLEFPGGALASCTTSLGINLPNYLHAACEKGSFRLEPFSNYNGIQGYTSKGVKLEKLVDEAIPQQQTRQMDDDAAAILQNKPVLVPGEEGLKDIRVLEAIYRSAREGKRVVIGD
jgi:glucose-fructose oxidoreductase